MGYNPQSAQSTGDGGGSGFWSFLGGLGGAAAGFFGTGGNPWATLSGYKAGSEIGGKIGNAFSSGSSQSRQPTYGGQEDMSDSFLRQWYAELWQ